MKLRNKKTGEIGNLKPYGGDEKIWVWIDNKSKPEYRYNSLAELNEEWCDYEEPKEYWFMDYGGRIKAMNDSNDEEDVARKEIGNYFDTREEAELAVRKLKAWKRLKDKGFRFEYYDYADRDLYNHIQIKAIVNKNVEDAMLSKLDLDLLFSQEED